MAFDGPMFDMKVRNPDTKVELLHSPEKFNYLDQNRIRSEQGRMKFYRRGGHGAWVLVFHTFS